VNLSIHIELNHSEPEVQNNFNFIMLVYCSYCVYNLFIRAGNRGRWPASVKLITLPYLYKSDRTGVPAALYCPPYCLLILFCLFDYAVIRWINKCNGDNNAAFAGHCDSDLCHSNSVLQRLQHGSRHGLSLLPLVSSEYLLVVVKTCFHVALIWPIRNA